MAGGVTLPAARCALPPLLLLLPLLSPVGAAEAPCVRPLNATTEHGQRRSELLVDAACGCASLALFVLLNASGMPVACGHNGSWHDTKQTATVAGGRAVLRTVVAGCFQTRCECADGSHCRRHWHFDGLDYYSYNLEISAEQMAGRAPRLDVHAVHADRNATQFYFQQLEVRLYRCPRDERAKTADPVCGHQRVARVRVSDGAAELRVQLSGARGSPLTAGRYRLEVLPAGSWVCQGSNNGCRRIERFVELRAVVPAATGAALPAGGDERLKALYAVVGVTLAVLAAGLVFLWRECLVVRPGQAGAPVPVKAPAPSRAPVLLVHLWSGERLSQLKAELRRAGLEVLDVQEGDAARLLRAMPVEDVLVSERLRHAKIVFLASERARQLERGPAGAAGGGGGFSGGGGGLRGAEALYRAVLLCVRNSALAQDYRRVFVVLPEGIGSDFGPAALVPGCRFRWPADVPQLIRQLNLEQTETGCERVV